MSDRFACDTRWGARLTATGEALFRLWAPALRSLRLRLDSGAEHAMTDRGAGWFELTLPGVPAGTAYSFVMPDGAAVPDPAARAQLTDVHGPSRLVDPHAFEWRCGAWTGRPWEEAVVYEIHVGTFSDTGDFDGVRRRLDALAATGVTALELMPVAQFAGTRGWGYDGVLPYCAHRAYGGVEGLKRLVDAAHERGLMMLLDVVYNHFGPDGNYLARYAPQFQDATRTTPWGAAIRFEERAVRDFFIDNALYWLEEYRFDGLRLDAIDRIDDRSATPILEELARHVRAALPARRIHLTTEDERNIVALHPYSADGQPTLFTAEWNDDFHHCAHCIASGERSGYYAAFADDAVGLLGRTLAEGFAYQGEAYAPWQGQPRGAASAAQPPLSFIAFLQNHDQIGNRAQGERLSTLSEARTLELLTAVLLLSPQIPLLFMGEEYGETRPFLFFTDFEGELARAVREGRRREFAAFDAFADEAAARVPDPNAIDTFRASRLDWSRRDTPAGRARRALIERLLAQRRRHIVPRLRGMQQIAGDWARLDRLALSVVWTLGDGMRLVQHANFGARDLPVASAAGTARTLVHETAPGVAARLTHGELPAHSVAVVLAAP